MPIRVAILIPGILLRAGLRALLEAQADIEVIEDRASTGRIRRSSSPDVLMVSHSELELDLLLEMLDMWEHLPGIVLIGDKLAALSELMALPVRAWGVLPADANEEELIAAVRAVGAGLNVQTPELYSEMLDAYGKSAPAENHLVESLTAREQEVLRLLAQGLANKQIALELEISEHTVKFHVSSIYGKMNAANRTEAVRLGLQNGLISL